LRAGGRCLAPSTKAYHAIWIDGVQFDLEDPENKRLRGSALRKTYLPRKFKTAFVIPPHNDMDVFTNAWDSSPSSKATN
jgi:sulfite reductase (NADPH) hemoprotein beta-component